MYNRYLFDEKFKKETKDVLLVEDIRKREELNAFKLLFTKEKLIESQLAFLAYMALYGDKEPVQIFRPKVNEYANYFLSFSHFIPTNQPYARKVNQIIDRAITNLDKAPDAISVFNAVVAIKQVYDEMHKKHIRGTTKQSICNLLEQFNLDVKESTITIKLHDRNDLRTMKDTKFEVSDVENTLNYITELDDRKRIISPYD